MIKSSYNFANAVLQNLDLKWKLNLLLTIDDGPCWNSGVVDLLVSTLGRQILLNHLARILSVDMTNALGNIVSGSSHLGQLAASLILF